MNETIDDVAREMTAGEPADAAGFRGRVLARIERGDAPRQVWRASFVLSPIAIAAAIVMALLVARDHRPGRLGPGETAGPRGPVLPQAATQAKTEARAAQNVAPRSLVGIVSLRTAARTVAPRRLAPRTSTSVTLLDANDVASIAIAPLAVETMTTDPIHLERLDAIEPIAVAPLDITDSSRRHP